MIIKKPDINIITCILDEDRNYVNIVHDILKNNSIDNFVSPEDIQSFISTMTEDIHICILEYNLDHNTNGLEIMRNIQEKNPQCYIIMMSDQVNIDIVTEFYDNEGFRYIRKGTNNFVDKLVNAVKKARTNIERNLTFHFEVIEKFNKTQEIFNNARHTIDNSIGYNTSNNILG